MNILNRHKNPAIIQNRKRKLVIAGFIVLILIGVGVASYPFWPLINYWINPPKNVELNQDSENSNINVAILPAVPSEENNGTNNNLNTSSNATIHTNLLIIPKIGVKIPIVEGTTEKALNKGAWRLPETSTPDKGSNTVITGHRWLYKPPSQKTFYLLDKLEIGDNFKIIWEGKDYNYKISGVSIVLPTDVWVLNPTTKSVVTLITCTPLFSTEKRLVVKAELILQ